MSNNTASSEAVSASDNKRGGTAQATRPQEPVRHLNQRDLARRWSISERTLERWRWKRIGIAWLKIGNHAVYRLEDIEAYEAEQRRVATAV